MRGELLSYWTVRPHLHERLRRHQRSLQWGDHVSLADAVRHQAAEVREAREAEHAAARGRWTRAQAAKRARQMRIVRAILLALPCAYCGGKATEIDHIMPRSRGGEDVVGNLAPSCQRCNIEKFNRTLEEWKAHRLNLGRPWPPPPRVLQEA